MFLTKHLTLDAFRAIKRIDKNNLLYLQLMKEAHILKDLKHSNIPIIYDIEEDDKYSYIIEEYIDGISLKEYRKNVSSFEEKLILHYSLQICDLVEFLHTLDRAILYLDLKPENIMISGGELKLIDFGTATYYEERNQRRYATGTRGYASPEQYSTNLLDERSDIYGIGMLLFFLITGISFHSNVNSIVNIDEIHSCSKALKNIINKCLKYNPSQRFQSVTALKEELLKVSHKITNHSYKKSDKTLSISIAGSQRRIGVTHISLLLSTYFNQNMAMCLYSEENNTQAVNKLINRYQDIQSVEYIYPFDYCYMVPNYHGTILVDKSKYSIVIKDYGMITETCMEEYLKADYKLLVLGAKDWELEETEQILGLLEQYKDINYLFNFIDAKTFHNVMKYIKNRTCFRMPYEPDPFHITNNESMEELVTELFEASKQGRYRKFINKVRGII